MVDAIDCENCMYYEFDEEAEGYICTVYMDEDEMARFYQSRSSCPYFRFYDEYKMVQKQN